MRIGIISDTHDRTAAATAAVALLRAWGVGLVLHCGDIESPVTVRLFARLPVHFVFGNWDGDWIPSARSVPALPGVAVRPRDDARLRRTIREIGGVVHDP